MNLLSLLCQSSAQLLAKVRLAICLLSTAVLSLGAVSIMHCLLSQHLTVLSGIFDKGKSAGKILSLD